jgi:CRISPR-associated protein Csd1
MSWIEKLNQTYERCYGAKQFEGAPLMPICHVRQQAHVEVTLDAQGRFLRARVVQKEPTVIPATEDSASRSNNEAPHGLCDKIQYCASDYAQRGGGKKPYFESFKRQLTEWSESSFGHPKTKAVLTYVTGGSLLADLIASNVLAADGKGELSDQWESQESMPPLLKLLRRAGRRDQGDALVRWRVEIPGEQSPAVWEDKELQDRWIRFCRSKAGPPGIDLVTGDPMTLATKHPRGIRYAGDGAKLISSNDETNFTFRGQFRQAEEACGVGFEVTQKAHTALGWLIQRQGARGKSREQAVVSWAIGGERIPDPLGNTAELFAHATQEAESGGYQGDAGQQLALRLGKLAAGYRTILRSTEGIVIMSLDSANRGRIAITFYRELTGSEYLERILDWHSSHAWQQNFSKELRFIGSPAPRDIAEAAYGRRLDENLRKVTVERLLPCIVDGQPVPRDLVDSTVRRSCNRAGLKPWDWEKCLGIACGLYRGQRKEEKYQMALEEDRTTRDYLYGRLLAIADYTERQALYVAGEKRDSNAARLMQRFADHPFSSWRSIELALVPYQSRLRANRPGLLTKLEKLLDAVLGRFLHNDFTSDSKLSGEFLLGYHCQRAALWHKPDSGPEALESAENSTEGGEQ